MSLAAFCLDVTTGNYFRFKDKKKAQHKWAPVLKKNCLGLSTSHIYTPL